MCLKSVETINLLMAAIIMGAKGAYYVAYMDIVVCEYLQCVCVARIHLMLSTVSTLRIP